MIDGGCGWFPTFRHVRLAIHVLGSNPGRSRMTTFLLSYGCPSAPPAAWNLDIR